MATSTGSGSSVNHGHRRGHDWRAIRDNKQAIGDGVHPFKRKDVRELSRRLYSEVRNTWTINSVPEVVLEQLSSVMATTMQLEAEIGKLCSSIMLFAEDLEPESKE